MSDRLDPVEEAMFRSTASGMHRLTSSVTSGGRDSGLRNNSIEHLAREIVGRGGDNRNPTAPPTNQPYQHPDISDNILPSKIDGDMLIDINQEMRSAGVDIKDNLNMDVIDRQNKPMDLPYYKSNKNNQPHQQLPQEDKNQMMFDLDSHVKAEDVFNMLSDIRDELKAIKKKLNEQNKDK
jgi:hypothetical protein